MFTKLVHMCDEKCISIIDKKKKPTVYKKLFCCVVFLLDRIANEVNNTLTIINVQKCLILFNTLKKDYTVKSFSNET
jgi:hypothetical protein